MKTKEVVQGRQRKLVKLMESTNYCKGIVKEPHMKIEENIRKRYINENKGRNAKRQRKGVKTKGISQLL